MNTYSNKNYNEGFQWGAFLLGVLYLILAFFAFNHPVISIVSVTYIFAIGAILIGLYELFVRRRLRQHAGYNSIMLIVIGVIDILIGIFFLFNISAAIITLPFLFAIWLIIDSVGAIITASPIRNYSNTQYWFTIIIGILGVVLGFLLIFNPLSSFVAIATLAGLYFMLYGVLNIVYAF